MDSIKKQMQPKTFKPMELKQSAGILDDHSIRKSVATREGTITKTPVNAFDIANKAYVDLGAHTVAGNNTEIQFNNSGAFGASSNLVWDGTWLTTGKNKGFKTSWDAYGGGTDTLTIAGDASGEVFFKITKQQGMNFQNSAGSFRVIPWGTDVYFQGQAAGSGFYISAVSGGNLAIAQVIGNVFHVQPQAASSFGAVGCRATDAGSAGANFARLLAYSDGHNYFQNTGTADLRFCEYGTITPSFMVVRKGTSTGRVFVGGAEGTPFYAPFGDYNARFNVYGDVNMGYDSTLRFFHAENDWAQITYNAATYGMQFQRHIHANVDNTYDVGTSAIRWRDGWFSRDIIASGSITATGAVTGSNLSGTNTGNSASWPIGAVFFSVVSTNPNTLLGFGTWSQIGTGKFVVGINSADADFDTVEETGGAKTLDNSHVHTLSAHTHDIGHAHAPGTLTSGAPPPVLPVNDTALGVTASGVPSTDATNSQGSATQSILPPYIVLYMWKRTA